MYIIDKCPYCGGEIERGMRKCRHCGEWLPAGRPDTVVVKERSRTNGFGTAGFVLALASVCLSWAPLAGCLIWFFGLLFSFLGLFNSPRGLAIAGFVISLVNVVLLIFVIGAFSALAVLFA